MTLAREFEKVRKPRKPRRTAPKAQERRPAPFSVRLSADERARLVKEAGGMPLGAFIKYRALEKTGRRPPLSVDDQTALAKVLALLGRSRLASNLNQLAWAVNIGSLPVTPETEAELARALRDIRDIRRLLLKALGQKPEDRP